MTLHPDHGYGYCPRCLNPGEERERRPNGNDTCANGHVYPSRTALSGSVALARLHMMPSAGAVQAEVPTPPVRPQPSREVVEWQTYHDGEPCFRHSRAIERVADPPPDDREPAGPWEPFAFGGGRQIWRRPLRALDKGPARG